MPNASPSPAVPGKLAQNVMHFGRVLRAAGLSVGPGSVIDAIAAVEAAGFSDRKDFHATLQAVFVKKREDMAVFDEAFRVFWRKRGFLEKLIAMMSPIAKPPGDDKQKPDAGATRVAEAMQAQRAPEEAPPPVEVDASFTFSQTEVLQRKDFAQMSAEEIAAAKQAIAKLRLPDDALETRRYEVRSRGRRIDLRTSIRRSLRTGGAIVDLTRRSRRTRLSPIVAVCDISGSMSDYTRVFLHFLHAMAMSRPHVDVFLFGTRLSNVTRALRNKDVDEALALCSDAVEDWSGGTRIAASLHVFNRHWTRRVLSRGAIVILFTDGLEREANQDLAAEMDRLSRSCRKLIWVNPLLRYDAFAPKASGIRAMLPFVDEFRPIHNLRSMKELCTELSRPGQRGSSTDPHLWLKRAG
jgi:uncharacterized protein with von Willebrand factor type A (vWA) domain